MLVNHNASAVIISHKQAQNNKHMPRQSHKRLQSSTSTTVPLTTNRFINRDILQNRKPSTSYTYSSLSSSKPEMSSRDKYIVKCNGNQEPKMVLSTQLNGNNSNYLVNPLKKESSDLLLENKNGKPRSENENHTEKILQINHNSASTAAKSASSARSQNIPDSGSKIANMSACQNEEKAFENENRPEKVDCITPCKHDQLLMWQEDSKESSASLPAQPVGNKEGSQPHSSISEVEQRPNFVCKTCGREFHRRNHLTRHEKMHLTSYEFPCKHCKKSFYRRDQFMVHLRSHTGERPYKCPVFGCGKRFTQKGALNRHMKVHPVSSSEESSRKNKLDTKNIACPQLETSLHEPLNWPCTSSQPLGLTERDKGLFHQNVKETQHVMPISCSYMVRDSEAIQHWQNINQPLSAPNDTMLRGHHKWLPQGGRMKDLEKEVMKNSSFPTPQQLFISPQQHHMHQEMLQLQGNYQQIMNLQIHQGHTAHMLGNGRDTNMFATQPFIPSAFVPFGYPVAPLPWLMFNPVARQGQQSQWQQQQIDPKTGRSNILPWKLAPPRVCSDPYSLNTFDMPSVCAVGANNQTTRTSHQD
eukprot:gene841-4113_t